MADSIARAQRAAFCASAVMAASSSRGTGTPNTARMPSPMKRSSTPSCAMISAAMVSI